MAISRDDREYKKKMGQYMTPHKLAKSFISRRNYKLTNLVLEPSFGDGSFILSIIDRFIEIHQPSDISSFVSSILENNLYGVELDADLYKATLDTISNKYDINLTDIDHNLYQADFFDVPFFAIHFDYIEGNPPFGGSFDEAKGIILDKIYGIYDGIKIKKETYSFFTHRCINLLKRGGELGFICSDTFMTIPTMTGVRKMLMDNTTKIEYIDHFSDETDYPMVYFTLIKKSSNGSIIVDGTVLSETLIKLTDTLSFSIDTEYSKYFGDELLSNYILCSSGMTIGKNELFLKDVVGNKILETISYEFRIEKKTIDKEKLRARLGRVSKQNITRVNNGDTEKILITRYLDSPIYVDLTDVNYKPYNKASAKRYYTTPTSYIYWKDDGEAVYTFKKTGRWYLHGIGGKKFFEKEGLTWRLISNDIRCRYLPSGYILDSGSPIGILRSGINKDELYFLIGWLNTNLATRILKKVINHTRNIQSKDIERMPYPYWVSVDDKTKVINKVKEIINKGGNTETDTTFIEALFEFNN